MRLQVSTRRLRKPWQYGQYFGSDLIRVLRDAGQKRLIVDWLKRLRRAPQAGQNVVDVSLLKVMQGFMI